MTYILRIIGNTTRIRLEKKTLSRTISIINILKVDRTMNLMKMTITPNGSNKKHAAQTVYSNTQHQKRVARLISFNRNRPKSINFARPRYFDRRAKSMLCITMVYCCQTSNPTTSTDAIVYWSLLD